jgi:hypothetical protein
MRVANKYRCHIESSFGRGHLRINHEELSAVHLKAKPGSMRNVLDVAIVIGAWYVQQLIAWTSASKREKMYTISRHTEKLR